MLPTPKLNLVAIARKQLRLSEPEYRALLAVVGVNSSIDLNEEQFAKLVALFEERGFESALRRRSFGERAGMATPKQVEYIRKLWRDYTQNTCDGALGRWLEHKFGVSSLRFVNAEIAGKAIHALRKMNQRKQLKGAS